MAPLKLRLLPEAEGDLIEARDWYLEREPAASERFLDEINRGITRALKHPLLPRPDRFGVRRIMLRVFPYSLVYVIRGEVIEVLAISHQKPGHWRKRLQ